MKFKTIEWDGVQITKPGMYGRIPLETYHHHEICDGPSISSSLLRLFNPDLGSPRHFYAKWGGNPHRVEPEEKRYFILGRALHHLCLGEKFFAKVFVQQPAEYEAAVGELKPWNNNALSCKAWNALQAKNRRTILTPKEVEQIRQMAISVGNHPMVREGLLRGLIERSFFWKDKETGIWLKWRPDSVPTDSADFGDLKSTTSVMRDALARTIRELGYYQQVALGAEATRHVLDMEMASFTYLFVEKQSPWCTRDERLFDEDINRGARMNRACLNMFAKCLKDNYWPGPGEGNEGNERIGLSATAREIIDKRLQYEGLADGQD